LKSRPQRSLRQLLLAWLLPGVVVLLLASASAAYLVAVRNANEAYDRSLLNSAIALANQVKSRGGRPHLDLQVQGREILLTDKYDRIHFAVQGPVGELLGGEAGIYPADQPLPEVREESYQFYDAVVQKQVVRGVVYRTRREGHALTVLVCETRVKRESQVSGIVLNILMPEIALVAMTVALIMFGVGSGLRPLELLRRKLARRSPADLSPLGTDDLPVELVPLATEVDSLLGRLDVALKAQRYFVSDAAHQLRTPIAALQAQIEAGGTGDPRMVPLLGAVQRLSHMVNQLLALARAEPAGMPVLQPLALDDLVRERADQWLPAAIARNVDLGFDLAPAPVQGAALLLGELVGNLVDNAVRHAPSGGQVTVATASTADGGALLTVDDNGPGIPPAQRERVFERFVRLQQETESGCGLGLAIVRQIATQHGATVRVVDSPLGGARFEVRFAPSGEAGASASASGQKLA